MRYTKLLTATMLLMTGCTSIPENPTLSNKYPSILPDYIGVTIPAEIAPLNFYVAGDSIEVTDVVIRDRHGRELHANGDYAAFDIDEWHALTRQNRGDSLSITVAVKCNSKWTEYQPFYIHVSNDSLGEWGLTYRLVPPGYETYGQMGIYQRNLATFEETPIIENKMIGTNCVNCHTTNRTDPSQFTFHVRGEHGATIVTTNKQTDILAPRIERMGGSMVYPFWHPSGNYIAYSTNQTHQNFHQLRDRRVEVYDDKSDIILYRPQTKEILIDSIVATPDHLENFPAFSPDGKTLYFCAATQVDSIWKQYKDVKYNICRIPFDATTGKFVGSADTIINARSIGKSANMPRISYDGHLMLYTLSDYGCFPIWHPEADLWMMNLETGENWALDAANSNDAESFHNWSLNSRWIVLTSRRDNGLYTQLYLAHVDTDGQVSKAFRLPQQNPKEYDIESGFSFNTPDFTTSPINLMQSSIPDQIMEISRLPINVIIQQQEDVSK